MDKSQQNSKKLDARTDKYGKQMKSKMRPCVFDDRSPIIILRLLDQFKRPCATNEVSKGLELWIRFNFKKEESQTSFNNLLVPIRVSRDAYARPKKCDDKIGTYAETVNHLLKFYSTNAKIAKKISKIDQLVKLANESAVQLTNAVRLKAVRCGNA